MTFGDQTGCWCAGDSYGLRILLEWVSLDGKGELTLPVMYLLKKESHVGVSSRVMVPFTDAAKSANGWKDVRASSSDKRGLVNSTAFDCCTSVRICRDEDMQHTPITPDHASSDHFSPFLTPISMTAFQLSGVAGYVILAL